MTLLVSMTCRSIHVSCTEQVGKMRSRQSSQEYRLQQSPGSVDSRYAWSGAGCGRKGDPSLVGTNSKRNTMLATIASSTCRKSSWRVSAFTFRTSCSFSFIALCIVAFSVCSYFSSRTMIRVNRTCFSATNNRDTEVGTNLENSLFQYRMLCLDTIEQRIVKDGEG